MDVFSEAIKKLIREDIEKWAKGGREGFKEELRAALDAMIVIAENKEVRGKYEKMMQDDWLEAFLILHYHAIIGAELATRLTLSDGDYGPRRIISTSHDGDGRKHQFDLFLVDPHDIRTIARRAILVAMYYMDERHKVQRLLEDDTNV